VDRGLPAVRQALFDAFNDDPRVPLFLGQIQAAGVGWSCRGAADVANLEISWCPGDHVQGGGRVSGIRRGTGQPVTHWWLVAEGTVDEDLLGIVQRKSRTMDAVLDGKRVTKGMDVLAEFRQAVLKRHS
jgi:SWI/SNF-related matrix-associated actin-dependent regulator 1 of chromatin subfamily A